MQNFQQILAEAAQLKELQLKKDRKGYEALPQFLKSGIGYNKKFSLLRKQSFAYQYRVSNKIKQAGNSLFKQERYEQALSRYEQALAIFRYIESKTYENMKDEDLTYHLYDASALPQLLKEKYLSHLCALYLNICSCLTKANKKQDAITSADQALKIKKTVKAHYKKAQAYLKYVNRHASDIKLGLLELRQAYGLEKDPGILKEMYAAKDSYEKQQENSKNWFKFMFDKNKAAESPQQSAQQTQTVQGEKPKQRPQQKNESLKELQKIEANAVNERVKFEQTKQKLAVYVDLEQSKWLYFYQRDFVRRHGSKIYSILKIYQHEDLAAEFRAQLAKCLEKEDDIEKSKGALMDFISWLKAHPVDKISKYSQRYELQTSWIRQCRAQRSKQFEVGKAELQEDKLKTSSTQEKVKPTQQSMKRQEPAAAPQQDKQLQYYKQQLDRQIEEEQLRQKNAAAATKKKQRYISIAIVVVLLLLRFIFL